MEMIEPECKIFRVAKAVALAFYRFDFVIDPFRLSIGNPIVFVGVQ